MLHLNILSVAFRVRDIVSVSNFESNHGKKLKYSKFKYKSNVVLILTTLHDVYSLQQTDL